MDERTVRIRNRLGMHARPAAEFVKLAGSFDADVTVCRGDLEVNGKSIMGVLMLAAEQGAEMVIRTRGRQRSEAADALVTLIENGFGEN
ncbi:MAG: HPr family phosphocarrier protein [Gemmatimonadales bacterium]|nr:MAG: HPr family phosphocarrier protein [Gemmatimonadales bacterium]